MKKQRYTYQAIGADGELTTGQSVGENDTQIAVFLQKQGLTPIRIVPEETKEYPDTFPDARRFVEGLKKAGKRFSGGKELVMFAEDLGILLGSGVPLTRSLVIVSELAERKRFRQIISSVHKQVNEGSALWQALQGFPGVFPPIFVNMVKVGESGGVLEKSLKDVAEYLTSIQDLKEYLVSALTYPVILTLTAGFSVVVLLTYVVPKFSLIFADMGVALPLSTWLMLSAGTFLQAYWWALLLLFAAVVFGGWHYCRTPKGRNKLDDLKLGLPFLGTIHSKIEVSRFSRTLGTLLSNGMPILESLQIVRGVVLNSVLNSSLQQVYVELKQGEVLSRSLERVGRFPSLAVHLIGVGEETGRVSEMLTKVADIYDRELKISIKKLTALFEPLVILFMGLVIGAMVVSLLMAIFSVNEISI